MVMSSLLQEKLQRMSETKRLDGYKASLAAFELGAVVATDEFPPALRSVRARAGRMDRPSQGILPHAAGGTRALAWTREMFLASGIGTEQFYLATPFMYFPWIECKPIGAAWVENLETVYDLDFRVISHDKTILLSVDNEEYEWNAYWSHIE